MKGIILVVLLVVPSLLNGQDFLTGDWDGARTSLSNSGIDFEFVYTGEVFFVWDTDVDDKSTYLDNYDITATFNLNEILGWKGATLFTYFLGNTGGFPNDRVGTAGRYGTIQGISNIATNNRFKLYEFWLEQQFFDEKLSLLFGLYDLNSEFDAQETSGIFINPSQGIGVDYSQSGVNGPSIFATTSLALRLKYQPTENFYAMLGVFDGVPGDPNKPSGTHIILRKEDGLLIATELGVFENGEDFQAGFGKYSIGGWYYTADFEDLTEVDANGNPLLRNDNFGIYFSAEKFLFAEKNNPSQGLAAFLRVGIANADINILDYYWGTGINITGLISGRDEDVIGIAIGNAHAGKKYVEINDKNEKPFIANESIIEFTYSLQITNWFRTQLDYQYVMNPMGIYLHNPANVLGVRVEVTL